MATDKVSAILELLKNRDLLSPEEQQEVDKLAVENGLAAGVPGTLAHTAANRYADMTTPKETRTPNRLGSLFGGVGEELSAFGDFAVDTARDWGVIPTRDESPVSRLHRNPIVGPLKTGVKLLTAIGQSAKGELGKATAAASDPNLPTPVRVSKAVGHALLAPTAVVGVPYAAEQLGVMTDPMAPDTPEAIEEKWRAGGRLAVQGAAAAIPLSARTARAATGEIGRGMMRRQARKVVHATGVDDYRTTKYLTGVDRRTGVPKGPAAQLLETDKVPVSMSRTSLVDRLYQTADEAMDVKRDFMDSVPEGSRFIPVDKVMGYLDDFIDEQAMRDPFTREVRYLRDKKGRPLLDATGKPVPAGYDKYSSSAIKNAVQKKAEILRNSSDGMIEFTDAERMRRSMDIHSRGKRTQTGGPPTQDSPSYLDEKLADRLRGDINDEFPTLKEANTTYHAAESLADAASKFLRDNNFMGVPRSLLKAVAYRLGTYGPLTGVAMAAPAIGAPILMATAVVDTLRAAMTSTLVRTAVAPHMWKLGKFLAAGDADGAARTMIQMANTARNTGAVGTSGPTAPGGTGPAGGAGGVRTPGGGPGMSSTADGVPSRYTMPVTGENAADIIGDMRVNRRVSGYQQGLDDGTIPATSAAQAGPVIQTPDGPVTLWPRQAYDLEPPPVPTATTPKWLSRALQRPHGYEVQGVPQRKLLTAGDEPYDPGQLAGFDGGGETPMFLPPDAPPNTPPSSGPPPGGPGSPTGPASAGPRTGRGPRKPKPTGPVPAPADPAAPADTVAAEVKAGVRSVKQEGKKQTGKQTGKKDEPPAGPTPAPAAGPRPAPPKPGPAGAAASTASTAPDPAEVRTGVQAVKQAGKEQATKKFRNPGEFFDTLLEEHGPEAFGPFASKVQSMVEGRPVEVKTTSRTAPASATTATPSTSRFKRYADIDQEYERNPGKPPLSKSELESVMGAYENERQRLVAVRDGATDSVTRRRAVAELETLLDEITDMEQRILPQSGFPKKTMTEYQAKRFKERHKYAPDSDPNDVIGLTADGKGLEVKVRGEVARSRLRGENVRQFSPAQNSAQTTRPAATGVPTRDTGTPAAPAAPAAARPAAAAETARPVVTTKTGVIIEQVKSGPKEGTLKYTMPGGQTGYLSGTSVGQAVRILDERAKQVGIKPREASAEYGLLKGKSKAEKQAMLTERRTLDKAFAGAKTRLNAVRAKGGPFKELDAAKAQYDELEKKLKELPTEQEILDEIKLHGLREPKSGPAAPAPRVDERGVPIPPRTPTAPKKDGKYVLTKEQDSTQGSTPTSAPVSFEETRQKIQNATSRTAISNAIDQFIAGSKPVVQNQPSKAKPAPATAARGGVPVRESAPAPAASAAPKPATSSASTGAPIPTVEEFMKMSHYQFEKWYLDNLPTYRRSMHERVKVPAWERKAAEVFKSAERRRNALGTDPEMLGEMTGSEKKAYLGSLPEDIRSSVEGRSVTKTSTSTPVNPDTHAWKANIGDTVSGPYIPRASSAAPELSSAINKAAKINQRRFEKGKRGSVIKGEVRGRTFSKDGRPVYFIDDIEGKRRILFEEDLTSTMTAAEAAEQVRKNAEVLSRRAAETTGRGGRPRKGRGRK